MTKALRRLEALKRLFAARTDMARAELAHARASLAELCRLDEELSMSGSQAIASAAVDVDSRRYGIAFYHAARRGKMHLEEPIAAATDKEAIAQAKLLERYAEEYQMAAYLKRVDLERRRRKRRASEI